MSEIRIRRNLFGVCEMFRYEREELNDTGKRFADIDDTLHSEYLLLFPQICYRLSHVLDPTLYWRYRLFHCFS